MLATAFGEAIGLEVAELRELGLAAVLHDVGKGLTPLEILRKPDELTDGEREVVERHPVDGAAILLACPDLPAVAPVVAFEHHLHYDLTGYPQVPDKRELSLFSMVVSLAHTFDALTTHRPGRPAMRPDEARAAMGSMPEGRFEPRLADWFRQMLGTYPPGMCVELDTGECAVVRRSDPSSERRPVVCVVMDADGGPVSSPYEVELPDRQTDGTGCPGSIARPIAPDERGIKTSYLLDAWIQLYCSAQ
jgi:HD-GYP domain-containing protein (c-di-GMP phosphodiesterase class II)